MTTQANDHLIAALENRHDETGKPYAEMLRDWSLDDSLYASREEADAAYNYLDRRAREERLIWAKQQIAFEFSVDRDRGVSAISSLSDEAGAAGDREMHEACERWLHGDALDDDILDIAHALTYAAGRRSEDDDTEEIA